MFARTRVAPVCGVLGSSQGGGRCCVCEMVCSSAPCYCLILSTLNSIGNLDSAHRATDMTAPGPESHLAASSCFIFLITNLHLPIISNYYRYTHCSGIRCLHASSLLHYTQPHPPKGRLQPSGVLAQPCLCGPVSTARLPSPCRPKTIAGCSLCYHCAGMCLQRHH